MFWIGLIVGIVIWNLLSFAVVVGCMWLCNISIEEFGGLINITASAVGNRESRIQVWHDDELLDEVTLEEK